MSIAVNADKCFSFISCQINPQTRTYRPHAKPRPAVTLSRQTGAGAMAVADKLAEFLQARDPASCGWTIFNKNLIEKVLEEHHQSKDLAKFMPEDRVSAIEAAMEELLGLHPSTWTILQQTTETILHLAEIGNVILVGRGANVITRQMKNVFHVRLVAPLEQRVEAVMKKSQQSREAALETVKKEDRARERYLKDYFKADVNDCMLYDLVVNTAHLSHTEAAHIIGEAVIHWAETL